MEVVKPTATTYIKPHRQAKNRTALQSLKDRFDYGLNPEKLGAVSAYLCDPQTAHLEFMLVKGQYQAAAGQQAERGVLCYQIRQAFPKGELTPEEANKIGYETAMRWTKGTYQFFVCTHIDKGHIHNHLYDNSTAHDCTRKFRNFLGSTFALRRLSDRVCLEHDLSVILNPKPHSKGKFLHYGQWLGTERRPSQKERLRAIIDTALAQRPADLPAFLSLLESAGVQVAHGRGGVLSFGLSGYERPARWRSSTRGSGYGPEDVRAIIEGRAPARPVPTGGPAPRQKINLVIDIQQRMAQGKGPGYERWAKLYNLKQMAAALQYLQENGLTDYDALAEKTETAVDRAHALAGELRAVEEQLARTSALMGAVVDYAKTRPVFDGYKAARHSKKYLAEHEEELDTYRAAKASINELLGGAKLPKMEKLKQQRRELAEKKKALYTDYRQAQRDMRELVAVKGNVDHLLGVTDRRDDKEQAR